MKEFHAALEAQPDFPEALNSLGLLLQRSGDVEEAATTYRKLTTLQPDNADAHSNLGLTLLQMGDGKGAIKEFENALRLRPDDGGFPEKSWGGVLADHRFRRCDGTVSRGAENYSE